MNFLGRKIIFSFYNPPKCDTVIFDKTNSHYIAELILDDLPYFIFEVRPEKIYISFSLVFCFMKSLRILDWQNINRNKITLRTILGGILRYYRLVCFQFIDPDLENTVHEAQIYTRQMIHFIKKWVPI